MNIEQLTPEQLEQIARQVNAAKQRERRANRTPEQYEREKAKKREYMREYMRNKRKKEGSK